MYLEDYGQLLQPCPSKTPQITYKIQKMSSITKFSFSKTKFSKILDPSFSLASTMVAIWYVPYMY
jgi:hypothetical protein